MENSEEKPSCSACSEAFKTLKMEEKKLKAQAHNVTLQESAKQQEKEVDKPARRRSTREYIFGKDIVHPHHGKERRKSACDSDQEPSKSTDTEDDTHPEMSEYWLISAPGEKTCQQTFDSVNNLTAKQHSLCTNYKFQIPDLKVGTLDQLVGLSDDLGKLDAFVEQVTRKVAAYLGEVLEDQRDKLHENLMANNTDSQEEKQHEPKTANKEGSSSSSSTKRRRRRGERRERGRSHHHCQAETISRPFAVEARPRCARRGLGSFGGCGAAIDGCLALLGAAGRPPDEGGGSRTSQELANSRIYQENFSNPRHSNVECGGEDIKSSGGSRSSASIIEGPRLSMDGLKSTGADSQSDPSIEIAEDATMSSSGVFDSSEEDCENMADHKVISKRRSNMSDYDDTIDKSSRRASKLADCHNASSRRTSKMADFENMDGDSWEQGLEQASTMHNHPIVGPADLPSYLTRFQWDIAKYPIKQSLRNIADIISKQVGQIENDLKSKSQAYNNLKGNLQSLEKKQTGSLLTRNLADLVKKEHFILDSEYLQTLLVIVPKAQFHDWNANYEKITDMIVPRSSQMIHQDNEYGLFTVTLFKKVIDEFKLHAREKKFIVRDFIYNEEELAAGKNEITKLVTDKKKQFGPLVRWLKVNFSECFCAWIHVKALRVFVESVLRYGLPVNFQAILMHPHKKTMKRLRDILNQHYGHLDGSVGHAGSHVDNVDIPGLGFGQSEYYPYVFYKINVDMIEQKL